MEEELILEIPSLLSDYSLKTVWKRKDKDSERFYSHNAISATMQKSAARLIIVLPNELKCRHDIHYIDF